MNTYLAFYKDRKAKIKAEDLYSAVLEAREILKVPQSKHGLLSVVLHTKEGTQVTHSTSSI